MLIPTEAIAIVPAISSAPAISSMPASSSAPAGLSGLSQIRRPGLRNPPSTIPTGYSRKVGYPQTRGGLSLLPQIFRRHQHLPLGCQLQSPECSTSLRQSLYDLARLFRTPQASLPDSPPRICVLTTRPTPHSKRLIC